MRKAPARILLDTNIYILGASDPHSPEAQILQWAGHMDIPSESQAVIILSDALIQQIRQVARRVRNKDWSGEILTFIWRTMPIWYVVLDENEIDEVKRRDMIPREDIEVYVTAITGRANCFVSTNRKLMRAIVEQTHVFECLTPAEFVAKYLAT